MGQDPREPVGRIERTKTREVNQEQRRVELEMRTSTAAAERAGETRREVPQKTGGDQFHPTGALERFLQGIARRVEQGVGFYQTLRLPGRDRVIQDRREESGHEAASEQHSSTDMPAPSPSGARPHYFHDRTKAIAQQGAPAEILVQEKPLSPFEAALVQRFEAGKKQVTELPAGSFHFLKKTAAEWLSFFKGFLHRTVKKEAQLQSLTDQMIFRGLLKEKGSQGTGMMVGDLAFHNGLVEKFARFQVELAHLLPHMQGMEPGAVLDTALLAAAISTDQLQYYAIAAPVVDVERFTGMKEAAGIFTTLKTEAQVAEQLGLGNNDRVRRFSRNLEEDFLGRSRSEEMPERFVPWWRWDRESRIGLRNWFVPVVLGTIITVLVVVAWVVLR